MDLADRVSVAHHLHKLATVAEQPDEALARRIQTFFHDGLHDFPIPAVHPVGVNAASGGRARMVVRRESPARWGPRFLGDSDREVVGDLGDRSRVRGGARARTNNGWGGLARVGHVASVIR